MPVSETIRKDLERSSWIRRMFEEGRRLKERFGEDRVWDFSLGNPDVEPPPEFRIALRELADSGEKGLHSYMPNAGYLFTRESCARKASRDHAMNVGADGIVMTVGAAGALNVALKTILNPGDEVIVIRPYFAEYRFYIKNHGGVMIDVPSAADFSPDPDAIARVLTPDTAALIINTPNNPSGHIYPRADIEALATVLAKHGKACGRLPFLLVDEPYRELVYDGAVTPPVMDAYAETIVAYSYSKSLSLPGERIGYLAVSPACADRKILMDGLSMSNRALGYVNAPALMQRILVKLEGCTADTTSYRIRRGLISGIVGKAGIEFARPEGAFYLFCRVPSGGPSADDVDFVMHLKRHNILGVPGIGFGCPGWFRLSYCVAESVIRGSAAAFEAAVAAWRG